MPYDPHATYTGGASLFGGLQSFGQGLGSGIHEAIQERNKTQQELAADEQILNMGKQLTDPTTGKPYITPDVENEYLTGNDNKKKGIIAGLTRNFAMSMQQQQMQAFEEQKKAAAAYRNAEAQRQQALVTPPPPLSDVETKALEHYGYLRQFTPGKGVEYLPQLGNDKAAASPPQITPFVDPSTGQPVPGMTQIYNGPGHPVQIITNPDVKKPPSLQNYLGTGSGSTKLTDLDTNAVFDSPKSKGMVEIPILNNQFDPSKAGVTKGGLPGMGRGESYPQGNKYDQVPNPAWKSYRETPGVAPTITKTIKVPKSVWQKFQGGASVDGATTTQTQTDPATTQQANPYAGPVNTPPNIQQNGHTYKWVGPGAHDYVPVP